MVVYATAGLFLGREPNGELDLERVNDRPGDLILECKRAIQLAIIRFRPYAKTVSHRYDEPGDRLQDRNAEDSQTEQKATKSLGSKFDIRQFHEVVLSDGSVALDAGYSGD